MNKLRLAFVALALAGCQTTDTQKSVNYTYATPTKASEIPAVLLTEALNNCITHWTAKGTYTQGQVLSFCSCTNNQIRTRVTFYDYILMDTDARTANPSDATKARLADMMAKCLPELTQTGKPL